MMPYCDDKRSSRWVSYSALFTAVASTIWIIEEIFPRPILWAKIGLSYIPVILALDIGGARMSIAAGLGKVIVGSLLTGRIFSVPFWLSLGGTVCSLTAMIFLKPFWGKFISVYGISIAGSTANGIGQMLLASIIIWNPSAILLVWFPTVLWNIGAGIVVAAITSIIAKRLTNNKLFLINYSCEHQRPHS